MIEGEYRGGIQITLPEPEYTKGGINLICIPPFYDEISISADMRLKSKIHNILKII